MKKIRLLLVAFGLLVAIVSSGQTLTYKLANPRIIRFSSADWFEFDVQVKADAAGTYMFTGQVNLNFDNTTFSTWVTTLAPAFLESNRVYAVKYSTTQTMTGVTGSPKILNIGILGNSGALVADPFSSTDWVELTTSYQTIISVKGLILSNTGLAGISFSETSMNGEQFKITAPITTVAYTIPNNYDAGNFTDTYVGRVYATANGWTQSAATWATALNTSVYDGAATIPTTGTSLASAIRIHSGATLTVPPTGQLTAASIENNTANGLTIQSDATNTGSLITGAATGTGSAIAQSYMTTGPWHQVSPPLSGQPVADFLTATGNITNVATKSGNRGMMNYITGSNTWSSFYTNGSGGTLAAGQGYMMRTDASAAVNFAGLLTTGSSSVSLSGAGDTGWNLIGNPYSSAIDINSHDGTDFMAANPSGSVLDASSLGIYVWNEGAAKYDVINWGTTAETASLGQAFFVKSFVNAADVTFNSAMQVHGTSVLKSAKSAYPEIKLIAANDGTNASTSIKFISGTTKGLDPGYDAGLFSLGSTVSLYTNLVEDNGVNFMLQCLPSNDFSSMIIPVGINSKAGGQVVFRAEAINLPDECKIILEDKLSKTFTDLSKNDYTATIAANSSITDRFRLHTSYLTTGLDIKGTFAGQLSAYAIRNVEIRVKGSVSKQAVATLYDIQGRVVLVKNLDEGNLNIIGTPNLRTGIYMLYVKDNNKLQGFKIPINE